MILVARQPDQVSPLVVVATHDDGQEKVVLAHPDYAGARFFRTALDIPAYAVLALPMDGVFEIGVPETLEQYVRRRSWEVETGGVTVAGVRIATDRAAQGLIGRAHQLVTADETLQTVYFDTGVAIANGDPIMELNRDTVLAIGLAVGRHVQATFTRRAQALRALRAGTVTDLAGVEAIYAEAP